MWYGKTKKDGTKTTVPIAELHDIHLGRILNNIFRQARLTCTLESTPFAELVKIQQHGLVPQLRYLLEEQQQRWIAYETLLSMEAVPDEGGGYRSYPLFSPSQYARFIEEVEKQETE